MRTFLWAVVVMMAIDVFGKAVMLWKHDFERKPAHMVGDVAIATAMLCWAAWLLGGGGA